MTVFDMHMEVYRKVNEEISFTYDHIWPEQIDQAINEQIDLFIRARMKDHLDMPDGSMEKLNDIRPLIVRGQEIFKISNTYPLPADYRYYLRAKATATLNNKDIENVPVTLLDTEFEGISSSNSLYTSDVDGIFITLSLGGISIEKMVEDVILKKLFLTYVKKPTYVKLALDAQGDFDENNSLNSELSSEVLRIITATAGEQIKSNIYKSN